MITRSDENLGLESVLSLLSFGFNVMGNISEMMISEWSFSFSFSFFLSVMYLV